MAATLVGVSTTRELYVEDAGVPQDVLTLLTYTLYGPTGTLLLGPVVPSGVGGGYYAIGIDGTTYLTVQGLYREIWQGSIDGVHDLYRESTFRVGVANPFSRTLRELRQSVARLCADGWSSLATGGTTTTLLDGNLVESTNAWKGKWCYIHAGTGAGQIRRVASSDVGTLTPGVNFSPAPSATSYYELHQYRIEDYHDAINAAILDAGYAAMIPVVDESLLQVDGTLEYVVPADLYCLNAVWSGNDTDGWAELLNTIYARTWDVIPGRRILRIPTPTDGDRLRLVGHLLPERLLRDDSYCDVDARFITYKAAALLLSGPAQAGQQLDPKGLLQKANGYNVMAEQARPKRPLLKNAHSL